MPRFFFRTSKPMDPSPKTNPRATDRSRRRLDRRNAAKHFDYDVSTSSSSSAATTSSPRISGLEDSNGSLHTHSLDIDQTSFRVEGGDGEIEFICKSLGLTGIEDFAIPTDAWESRKIRSVSDVLPRSRLTWADSFKEEKEKDGDVRNELLEARVLTVLTGGAGGKNAENLGGFDVGKSNRVELVNETNGIKGSRPPMLRPPPSMRLPVIDDTCSTWDLLREFAPAENGDRVSHDDGRFAPTSDEEEEQEEVAEEGKVERTMAEQEQDRGIRTGETAVLSTSCSFSTSNDDDSSSSTSNISPNMRVRRTISYWEKGQLLGRGSFGSVYEGIAE